MAGNKGIPRRVTLDELAKHNTEEDCWLAIYDKVYNVTPYMKYHPGGVDELMRGAGKVATDLFNKVHPWVNLTSMLEKCVVGTLVLPPPSSTPTPTSSTPTSSSSSSSKTPSSNLAVPTALAAHLPAAAGPASNQTTTTTTAAAVVPESIFVKPAAPEIPVLDSYQSNTNCIIVLYSKIRSLRKESIVIDKKTDAGSFLLFLYSPDAVYKYDLGTQIRYTFIYLTVE